MLRAVVLVVTVVTGATGLLYEVAWQKYLATLLGSHSEATATVLGLFLAGLSLGYRVFGAVAARLVEAARRRAERPRLLPAYALVEGGIGVYALVFPWLFRGVESLSLIGPFGTGGAAFGFDVCLCALLILPPTILMGGTIPLLTQGLSRDVEDATRLHALVYGFNTAGAFVGALLAGFALVPLLGLDGVMWAGGLSNVMAAVLLGWLGRREAAEAPPVSAAGSTRRVEGFVAYVGVALLTGFAMMGVQTVLNRIAALAFGSSPFTFSMVAALFVGCIAAGSLLVSLLPRIPPRALLLNQAALFTCLLFLDGFFPDAPFWAHVLRTTHSNTNLAFYAYYAAAFAALLFSVGPAAMLSGATLPLLFHHLRRSSGDLGATAGTLYAWNTVGSLLGAVLVGYVLLFWLDLEQVYRISEAAVAVSIALLAARVIDVPRWLLAGGTLLVLVYLMALPPWDVARLNLGFFRVRVPIDADPYTPANLVARSPQRLLAAIDDPTASIAIFETEPARGPVSRSIHTNGKSDSSTGGDAVTLAMLALLPALTAEQLESVFVVGWGTGVTVGELAALDGVNQVIVAEISPAVLELRPYFADWDLGATSSPKVRVIQGDAYRALRRSPRRFDAIVSEPSNPWVAGVEMLYAREFLESARERLKPGGVFVQWIHQYEIDARSLGLVLRTYGDVFEDVAIWYGEGADLLLLGCAVSPCDIDPERLARRASRPDVAAGLARAGIRSFPALLAHELWPPGVLHALAWDGPRHTLLHPRLNHAAVQAFFRADVAQLPFAGFGAPAAAGRRNSAAVRWQRKHGALSPEQRLARLGEACRHRSSLCVALFVEALAESPADPTLQERLALVAADEGRFGGSFDPADVLELAAITRGEATRPAPEQAARAMRNFVRYHAHGVNGPGRRLIEMWRRCEADDPTTCEAGQEMATGLLETGASAEVLRAAR